MLTFWNRPRLRKLAHSVGHWLHLKHEVISPLVVVGMIVAELEAFPFAVKASLLGLLLVSLTAVFVTSVASSARRLRLNRRWQVLAWTHYRPLLGEMMARSIDSHGRVKFDFVTYCGGECTRKVHSGALLEFKYSRFASSSLDILICDIENLSDLARPGSPAYKAPTRPVGGVRRSVITRLASGVRSRRSSMPSNTCRMRDMGGCY
jgi:hypothetical protein